MQRKGGFDVRENNIYYPERYDPTKTVAAQQNAPVTISAVTTPRGAQTTYRDMCAHHSIGESAAFVRLVNHLSSTLLKAVDEYEQTFPYKDLYNAVSAVENTSHCEVWFESGRLADIRNALGSEPIVEWEKWCLEEEIKCKACKLSLLFSTTRSIQTIMHFSHVLKSKPLQFYAHCLLEQLHTIRNGLTDAYYRNLYSGYMALEEKVRENISTSSKQRDVKLVNKSQRNGTIQVNYSDDVESGIPNLKMRGG